MLGNRQLGIKLYKRSSLCGENQNQLNRIRSAREVNIPSSQYRSRSQGVIGAERQLEISDERYEPNDPEHDLQRQNRAIRQKRFERDILGSELFTNKADEDEIKRKRGLVGQSETKIRDFARKDKGHGLETIWGGPNTGIHKSTRAGQRAGFNSGRAAKKGDSQGAETVGKSTQHQSWGVQSLGSGQIGQIGGKSAFNQSARVRASTRLLGPIIGDSLLRDNQRKKNSSLGQREMWDDIALRNQELTARTVDKVLEHGERSAKMLKDCFREFLNGFRKVDTESEPDSAERNSRDTSDSEEIEKRRGRSQRHKRRKKDKYQTRSNKYKSRSQKYGSRGQDSRELERERGRTVKSGKRGWGEDEERPVSEFGRPARAKSRRDRAKARKERRRHEREVEDLRNDLKQEEDRRREAERRLEEHLESENDLQRVTKGLEKEIANLKRTIKGGYLLIQIFLKNQIF